MRYYSKPFFIQCIITPVTQSLDSISILRSQCTFSTPWGAFWPGATSGAHTCHIKRQITFTSYRVHIYTPGWRAAMWIKCLAEGQNVPGIDENRTHNLLIQSQGFIPIYHGTSTSRPIMWGKNQQSGVLSLPL